MKHSIRIQFAFVTVGLLVFTILLTWLVNNFFLQKYYEQDKRKSVVKAFEMMEKSIEFDELNKKDFQESLLHYASKNNLNIVIMDKNANIVFRATLGDPDELQLRLFAYILGKYHYTDAKKNNDMLLQDVVNRFVDHKTGVDLLEMHGQLSNENWYIINTPMESIYESVILANRFLAYVGLFSIIVGGIIMLLIAERFTKPILELNDISQKVANLDFDAEYIGHSGNEIDQLGENINFMSGNLQKAISELKSANAKLQEDIEKREQIDEMRKEFLSNVTHELKTPLALIRGYAEGLQEGINDDEESRSFYCDVIVDEAEKMNSMVKKLLTLNQLEFGNDDLKMEPIDMVMLIQNYLRNNAVLYQDRITVHFEHTESVYAWGDVFKTEEVFTNYFTNAVNHCPADGYIDITIEQKEGKVRINVFNTGQPIPDSSLERIWEKFYKVDKARTREYGGSGVGLSIVKAIMESYGQKYGCENFTNGVQFWFELDQVNKE